MAELLLLANCSIGAKLMAAAAALLMPWNWCKYSCSAGVSRTTKFSKPGCWRLLQKKDCLGKSEEMNGPWLLLQLVFDHGLYVQEFFDTLLNGKLPAMLCIQLFSDFFPRLITHSPAGCIQLFWGKQRHYFIKGLYSNSTFVWSRNAFWRCFTACTKAITASGGIFTRPRIVSLISQLFLNETMRNFGEKGLNSDEIIFGYFWWRNC